MFLRVEPPKPIVTEIRQASFTSIHSSDPSDLPSTSQALCRVLGVQPRSAQAPRESERTSQGQGRRSPSVQNPTIW